MCEFCMKHGEGEKWYLKAKNYSDDLLSDIQRRRFIEGFFTDTRKLERDVHRVDLLEKAPMFVKDIVRRLITRRMKKIHFGQVLPIEEIEKIFGFVNSIVRVACLCRHITLGKEKRYCYGVSLSPDGNFSRIFDGLETNLFNSPDTGGLEVFTKEESISTLHHHEQEGLYHTIWTFHTPFIGGICNCDRSDCLAMHLTVTHTFPVMFRAEYVAEVNPDECIGCRECMRLCQFGAPMYSASNKKVIIDQRWCYGCGICRSGCPKNAIKLEERTKIPTIANLW